MQSSQRVRLSERQPPLRCCHRAATATNGISEYLVLVGGFVLAALIASRVGCGIGEIAAWNRVHSNEVATKISRSASQLPTVQVRRRDGTRSRPLRDQALVANRQHACSCSMNSCWGAVGSQSARVVKPTVRSPFGEGISSATTSFR